MVERVQDKDWVVEVGWDAKQAERGAQRLEKIMKRVNNTLTKGGGSAAVTKQNRELKRQNQIQQRRLSLLQKIRKAESLGISGLSGARGAMSGADPAKLRKRELDLQRQINDAQWKAKKASDAEGQSRKKVLETERQIRAQKAEAKRQDALQAKRFRKGTALADVEGKAGGLMRQIPSDTSSPALRAIRREAQEASKRVEQLKQRANSVKSATGFARLERQIRSVNNRMNEAKRSFDRTTKAIHRQRFASAGLRDSMKNLARSYLSVFAVMGGGMAFFRTGKQIESLQATMLAASGTSEQAAKDFDFVRRAALNLGIDLRETARGYTKIGAAANAAGLSTEETRQIFLAASESARAFGLNAQRTQLVFLAFDQILSKGKVSMEELRRQLGEQIPGAFQIAARSMNMTTSEFDKLVSSGKLASEEFLPKFSAELRKTVRETGALEASMKKTQAAQERFIAQLQLETKKGFDIAAPGLATFFQQLSFLVDDLGPAFKVFGRLFGGVAAGIAHTLRILAGVISPVATAFDVLGEALSNAIDENADVDKLTALEKVLRKISGIAFIAIGAFYGIAAAMEFVSNKLGGEDSGLLGQIGSLVTLLGALAIIIRPIATAKLLGRGLGALGKGAGKLGGKGLGKLAGGKTSSSGFAGGGKGLGQKASSSAGFSAKDLLSVVPSFFIAETLAETISEKLFGLDPNPSLNFDLKGNLRGSRSAAKGGGGTTIVDNSEIKNVWYGVTPEEMVRQTGDVIEQKNRAKYGNQPVK